MLFKRNKKSNEPTTLTEYQKSLKRKIQHDATKRVLTFEQTPWGQWDYHLLYPGGSTTSSARPFDTLGQAVTHWEDNCERAITYMYDVRVIPYEALDDEMSYKAAQLRYIERLRVLTRDPVLLARLDKMESDLLR